jgi:hypothetical protein
MAYGLPGGLVLMATAALTIGCGSGGGGGSSSTTPPATHQVTSSGAVMRRTQGAVRLKTAGGPEMAFRKVPKAA